MKRRAWAWASGDYALDGHLDIFRTHFAEDTDVLYHNDGTGNFDDRTLAAKIGVEVRFASWAQESSTSITMAGPTIFLLPAAYIPKWRSYFPTAQ